MNFLPPSLVAIVAIVLGVALAAVWSPPDSFLLYAIVNSVTGLILVLVAYGSNRWSSRFQSDPPRWLAILFLIVGLLAVLLYVPLYKCCVVRATRAPFDKLSPVFFPIWLDGKIAIDVETLGSPLALVNEFGPTAIIKQLPSMPNYDWSYPVTVFIFLLTNIVAYACIIIALGIVAARNRDRLPRILRNSRKPTDKAADTDIPSRRFRIALTFPGEYRDFVEAVAGVLAEMFAGEQDAVFYDNYYQAELARFNLKDYLEQVYAKNSELIAVFLCEEYENKDWTGVEWRVVSDLVKRRKTSAIMLIRLDDAEVSGVLSIDGYLDARGHSPQEIAGLIRQRYDHERSVAARASDEQA